MTDYQRYAVYYAPKANSDLAAFGNAWLGRDPATGREIARPDVAGLDRDEIASITVSPSRYGFHGTLKPPFALKDGQTRAQLENAIVGYCAGASPVSCGPLILKAIGSFIALVPTDPVGGLGDLASGLVKVLDGFRQPEDEAAMNKRRASGLSDRQEEYLVRWGYPYVMEEFRFHLTLTDKLDPDRMMRVRDALAPIVAPLCEAPFTISDVCLFGDPGDGKPFDLLGRFALG
jgi:putative phosphonate metabolism protein